MSSYDLESLDLPKLSGPTLRAFAKLLDWKATRRLLLPGLIKQGGIPKLRSLRLDRDPQLYPFAPAARPAASPLGLAEVDAAFAEAPAPKSPWRTSRDYIEAYRSGASTPVAVAEAFLAAVEASEADSPPLRAFVAIDRDALMAQAKSSAGRWATGRPLSRLDGVPVAIKDEVDLAPYPSRGGTIFIGGEPMRDGAVTERLRAAGALLLGKTNMNELGLDPSGFNAHYGTIRNPWDKSRDPGGSSSGSAAATAAGLCPVSIGCDGGGSIRLPSSLCGLVGLKPSFGRVSSRGTVALCPSVDATGPLASCVEDAALAYGLIAGPDPAEPRSLAQPPVDLGGWHRRDLRGLTLGVYREWFRHAAPDVVAACEAALDRLIESGAALREIEIQGLDAMRIAHVITIVSEQDAFLRDNPGNILKFGAPTRVTRCLAEGFSAADYVQAQRVRAGAIAAFESALGEVDAIVTPCSGITAPTIPANSGTAGWSDLSATTEKMRFVFPANLTGHPAISVPVGFDREGLPIGLQAMGRYWGEALLLRIASAVEAGSEKRLPKIRFDLLARS
jgi:Asp-tRNA(Asn)/Glu-tRNA(Gln) amidotransferase A subunit family amidase